MTAIVYLDTNIFIKAFEASDALGQAFVNLFALDVVGGAAFATSELSLAEVLVHPFKQRDEVARLRYDGLIQQSAWLQVGPVDRNVLSGAALLRSIYKLKLPDAIHVSTALHFGCEYVLTDDTDFAGSYHFDYITSGQTWRNTPVKVMRPELAQIASLGLELRS